MYFPMEKLGSELLLQTGTLFWQEGMARGVIRTCKANGLDSGEALWRLRSYLPDLPPEETERLVRFHWKDDKDNHDAVGKVNAELHRLTGWKLHQARFGDCPMDVWEQPRIQERLRTLAAVSKGHGKPFSKDYLQDQADALKLPLEELMKQLDRMMQEKE